MILDHLANIDPVILFFFLGAFASWLKSDLELPEAISKFLAIFLLLSLGIKGGHEVRVAESFDGFGSVLAIGILSCLLIPLYLFWLLRKRLGSANAAALASCYGSVSAVTFIAAQGFLKNEEIASSGFMVAVMALMEIPAIVIALALYRKFKGNKSAPQNAEFNVFSAKSVILLGGGFTIGLLMNGDAWSSVQPVVQGSFKGFLMFFLLDLGIAAQRQFGEALRAKRLALLTACLLPLLHGSAALVAASALGVADGDAILLATLAGSASYIAAPAAIRSSIPEASPSFYVALPLAFTFPMNVIIGIPLYIELAKFLE